MLVLVAVTVVHGFSWNSKSRFAKHVVMPSVNKRRMQDMAKILRRGVMSIKRSPLGQSELVFIIDSSKSVGDSNFRLMVGFVRLMLAGFEVDVNHTRVSVITYSSPSRVHRHIDYLKPNVRDGHDMRNKCSVKNDINKIPYDGGQTYTLGGFLEGQASSRMR